MPLAVPHRVLPLLLVCVLASCGGDPGQEPISDDEAAEAPALEGAPSPMDTMLHATIVLAEVGESGISGEAMAMHSDDAVVVILEMQGLTEDINHPAHIHAGRCEEGGPVVVALHPVLGLEDGTGTSTTSLDAWEVSQTAEYFIQVHAEDGTPVACGDMEGHGGT